MTCAQALQDLRHGIALYVAELRERASHYYQTGWAFKQSADELERRFLTPPAHPDAEERARYVNRWEADTDCWETGAQGPGEGRG